jgi:transcriptional regulator with XRE-family HTH domain
MRQELDQSADPVGLQLKLARVRSGRKQYEVAAKVGVSGTVLSRIEAGTYEPSEDLIVRLRAELGMPDVTQTEAVA